MATPKHSRAVDRATQLLTHILDAGGPCTFATLVEELGLARSTTWRLLGALEHNGLLQRDHNGAFRPGRLFVQYAMRTSATHDLAELARPILERLGELTEETVALAVVRGDEIVEIARVESTRLFGATNWDTGAPLPYSAAAGTVLHAHGALGRSPGQGNGGAPADRAGHDQELADALRRGWAASIDEMEVGLAAVAAPVLALDGAVVAAVSVSGPTDRITRRGVAELGEALRSEAARLTPQLGMLDELPTQRISG